MKPSVRWSECQLVAPISPTNPDLQSNQPTLRSRLERIWQSLVGSLVQRTELRVWHTCDRFGNIWWNAYDPSTGRVLYEVPEAEMRRWLEQRHHLYRKN